MTVQKILGNIMDTDHHIRYATICDMEGNEVGKTVREGVTPMLNDEEHKETLRYAVSAWKTRAKFAPKIGKGKYVLAVYENLRRLTMPLGTKHLLLITWGTDGGTQDIVTHIQNMFSGDPTLDW
ncbi:MAG: hypothetical protein ACREBI_07320 [Nitrosotalea sp.]